MALADWSRKVSNALDQALAEHIVLTQSKLAQDCPKDTGRKASSFYVGKDKPNLTVRPDDWSTPAKRKYSGGVGTEGVIVEPGVTRIEIPFYSNKITMDGNWYISNNLKYANRVAYDPIYSKGAPGGQAWFTNIATQQKNKLSKRIEKHMRKIK